MGGGGMLSLGLTWTHLVSFGLTWSNLESLGSIWIPCRSEQPAPSQKKQKCGPEKNPNEPPSHGQRLQRRTMGIKRAYLTRGPKTHTQPNADRSDVYMRDTSPQPPSRILDPKIPGAGMHDPGPCSFGSTASGPCIQNPGLRI